MRRAIVLLLASCASAGGDHQMTTTVTEVISRRQQVTVLGTHFMRVRIRNVSQKPIVVHSIHLEAVGPDLDSEQGVDSFDREIQPDETVPFDLLLTVTSRNRSLREPAVLSVAVTVSCAVEGLEFIDTGTYQIGREVLGG